MRGYEDNRRDRRRFSEDRRSGSSQRRGYQAPYHRSGFGRDLQKGWGERYQRREATPQPINGKCNPLCPFFWCGKRAYQVRRDPKTGRKYVYCTWIGDECIGASCQYASCKLNYLLPDGSCAYVKQKVKRQERDMMEELAGEEIDERTRGVLSKKFGKRRLEDIY